MAAGSILEKVDMLKQKFKHFFTHKKKLRALENYSEVAEFHHKDYLPLIQKCMEDGFLGQAEGDFLGHLIDRYQLDFLTWAHRTKWVKEEMSRILTANQKKNDIQLTMFNFEQMRKESIKKVPVNLLPKSKPMARNRV